MEKISNWLKNKGIIDAFNAKNETVSNTFGTHIDNAVHSTLQLKLNFLADMTPEEYKSLLGTFPEVEGARNLQSFSTPMICAGMKCGCPKGYYESVGGCWQCGEGCAECTDGTNCERCQDGFDLQQDGSCAFGWSKNRAVPAYADDAHEVNWVEKGVVNDVQNQG